MLNVRLTQLIRERQERVTEELKEEIFENAKRHLEQRFGKFEEELVLIAGIVHTRLLRTGPCGCISFLMWEEGGAYHVQSEASRRSRGKHAYCVYGTNKTSVLEGFKALCNALGLRQA